MSATATRINPTEERRATAEFGMWVFLATELMFFGPLFLGYTYGRWHFATAFADAGRHTDIVIGTLNTVILLTSSLAIALAVRAARIGERRHASRWLCVAATLGIAFLACKGVEYHAEWREHLIPWLDFRFDARQWTGARYFYFLYFGMTGLHAVHLTIGIVLVLSLARSSARLKMESGSVRIEMTGLYWHFVDAIWVFLYPMIYLVARHS